MKRIKSNRKRAMTLAELLISTVLIGIVLVGALGIDFAIRSSKNNIQENTNISAQIIAAMYSMTNDSITAVGDVADPGLTYDRISPLKNICFRSTYDIVTPANNRWVCYSLNDTDYILYRCGDLLGPLTANMNDQIGLPGDECVAPRKRFLELTHNGVTTYDTFFDIIIDGSGNIDYVEFDIQTLVDPTAVFHPILNPRAELTSRVSPIGLSRN